MLNVNSKRINCTETASQEILNYVCSEIEIVILRNNSSKTYIMFSRKKNKQTHKRHSY